MGEPIYAKMAVIGCGLIGSSVILAAREAGAVGEIAIADASGLARGDMVQIAGGPKKLWRN